MRVYIGAWLLLIALLVASVEGSVFIKVFTRFTEEIFASLISLLYIFESVTNMISVSIFYIVKSLRTIGARSTFLFLSQVFQRHPLLRLSDYCMYENSTHSNSTRLNDTLLNSTDPILTPLNATGTNNTVPVVSEYVDLICFSSLVSL